MNRAPALAPADSSGWTEAPDDGSNKQWAEEEIERSKPPFLWPISSSIRNKRSERKGWGIPVIKWVSQWTKALGV